MPDRPLRISVVLPYLKQLKVLECCFASLPIGQRQPDEIGVVDIGSRVLPNEVVAASSGARLLERLMLGPAQVGIGS